jgi:protein gp37
VTTILPVTINKNPEKEIRAMSTNTKIQWTDDTVNPTSGCDGCELWNAQNHICYAGRDHPRHRRLPGYGPSFDVIGQHPGRMAKAARWSNLTGESRESKPWLDHRPRHIFVSDMSDALSVAVTFEYLAEEVIAAVTSPLGTRHRWLWLTKRPGRMAEFSDWLAARGITWPLNLWPGTSLTSQGTCGRVADLLHVGPPGTRRFLSVEPQHGPIDLTPWLPFLDWVIQGGESGARAYPFDLAWARTMRDTCTAAGVPYFLKQLGKHPTEAGERLSLHDGHGGDWAEWPADLRQRQVPQ